MQSRWTLKYSKRCEIAKRRNANEENRLRDTIERCEKEYEKTMKNIFVEKHGVRKSIRQLRRVRQISLDTMPLVESETFRSTKPKAVGSGEHVYFASRADRRQSMHATVGTVSKSLEIKQDYLRVIRDEKSKMGQRAASMPDLNDVQSRPNSQRKSPTPSTTQYEVEHANGTNKWLPRTLPEENFKEMDSVRDNADGNAIETENSSPNAKNSPTRISIRYSSSPVDSHGDEGGGFVRRFRSLTLAECCPLAPSHTMQGTDDGFVSGEDGFGLDTESRVARALPSALKRRLRSGSVRTISAPGILDAPHVQRLNATYAEGRPRSMTLPDCTNSSVAALITRGSEQLRPQLAGKVGDAGRLLEFERGELPHSPLFRRRLSPSAGIAKLRQLGDAAIASRALISSYRRDQAAVKTPEELEATREMARKRAEKKKESVLHCKTDDNHGLQAKRRFISIARLVLAVNAFMSMTKKKEEKKNEPNNALSENF